MTDKSETKTTPTDSQIQVLMSDWLGNLRQSDEGNYTHSGKGGIRRSRETDLQDYLIGDLTGLDKATLMRRARQGARQMVNAIAPGRTEIHLGDKDSYMGNKDGVNLITLATNYFDDKTLTGKAKAGVMLGLAAHEAAHAAFTDDSALRRGLEGEPPETRELARDVWNILEDERIEWHLGERHPGFAEALGEAKGYYFKKLRRELAAGGKMPTEPLPKLLAALTQAVRYPSELTRDEVVDSFDELDAIRGALTPYPLTTDEVWAATGRVMDIVRDIARRQARERKSQEPGGADKSEAGQGRDPGQGGAGDSSQGDEPTEKEILQEIADALSTEQGKAVTAALRKDIGKSDGALASRDLQRDLTSRYVNEDSVEIVSGSPGDPDTILVTPKGDKAAYDASLRNVRRFIPAMSNALRCKSKTTGYSLKGLPSGRLDTNKLASIKCGNTNIFDRRGSVRCSSASVCILIDESGSMTDERVLRAREAAILVAESVARIGNVNFFCYGYTSSRMAVYSERGKGSRWALGETSSIGGTPTGKAMRHAASRIRRMTGDPALMLVLTDGGADDVSEVLRAERELERDSFSVIGVGIQTNTVECSFRESVVMQDISSLPLAIGKLTRGRLDKMLVRKDD